MKLLEVVRGAKTAKDVLATAMTVAAKIGKTAVVAGVCDGFIGNRMLEPYMSQAGFLLDEGALPQQVDRASAGRTVNDPFPAAPQVASRGITYYFVQDRSIASAIESQLRGEYGQAKLARFSPNAGLPRPGTIEITVGSD
jgi:hypothetical protein